MAKNNVSILLIGMTGCGKTTIGKVLAKRLAYNFFDMDEYIEKMSGKTIPELFGISEENFRTHETEACKRLALKKQTIISSGGGVIKKEENMNLFKENFVTIFIDRPVEDIFKDIDVSKRPLLANGRDILYKMKEERYDLYKKYADYVVENNGALEEVVDKIMKIVNS